MSDRNVQESFFKLLASTPMPADYAEEILEGRYATLKERMWFIVSPEDIVLPSPLYPSEALTGPQQSVNKHYQKAHSLLLNGGISYSSPIEYIPDEDRLSLFSALSIKTITQFIKYSLNDKIPDEKLNERKTQVMTEFRKMFERHISSEKIDALDNILQNHIQRYNVSV